MRTATDVETVYILGRSGRDGSVWFKDFDSLALFVLDKAPGSYWIRRATVPIRSIGWPEPIETADWGVLVIGENGRFAITRIADDAAREDDFRAACRNSPLPGPGLDG